VERGAKALAHPDLDDLHALLVAASCSPMKPFAAATA